MQSEFAFHVENKKSLQYSEKGWREFFVYRDSVGNIANAKTRGRGRETRPCS